MISEKLKKALDEMPVRVLYLKLLLLDFKENPIREIQGISQSGNISINGSAAIRRTISLSMFATKENNNLEDLNNLISLNKKVKVQVGYESPLPEETGPIVWFECGIYFISSANLSISVSGATISLTAKDKMVQLDGSVGGTFPASVTFHEYEEVYTEDNIVKVHPTIYQIIREAVHTYGAIPYDRIKIFDLSDTQLTLVKYLGDKILGFTSDYSNFKELDDYSADYPITFTYGEDVGYLESEFTYPGELVFSAGENIVSLLDKIVQTLGNYEYFFDIEGNFIFQQKRDQLYNNLVSLEDILKIGYLKPYPESWYSEIINDTKSVVSLNYSPKYDNIKNDFIVWGKKQSTSGFTSEIRYHLVIEKKPVLNLCKKYLYLVNKSTYVALNKPVEQDNYELKGYPCEEWREELYRQALMKEEPDGYCEAELLSEWRKMYDTMADWASQDTETKMYDGWNYTLLSDPGQLNYWLDYIDTNDIISQYSVSAIGRRSKVITNNDCHALFKNEIPQILFCLATEDKNEVFARNKDKGYNICFASQTFINNKLGISSVAASAYDLIKDLLYQYLVYNTSISISMLPKYYLEPNTLIYIKNTDNNIQGRFVINQMSLPLSYNGLMSISATQALSKI